MNQAKFRARVFVLVILGFLATSTNAHAYLVHEVEPGIVELRGIRASGLVPENVYVDKKHRWIYFVVRETGSSSSQNSELRFFYAPYSDFKINLKQRFKLLQFGVGHRVLNSKRKIPFGAQRYFY